MKITMIGHSCTLIEAGGMRILTDPWFGTWGNIAYARTSPPSQTREQIGHVDLVLISHNHWDHTDRRFLRSLDGTTTVLAPAAAAWVTKLKGAAGVKGLTAWEELQLGDVRISAVPAIHLAVARGFVIEAEKTKLYFAGDTYFGAFMNEIRARYAPHVALMPVTSFRLPPTMRERGAVRAVQALAPRTVIPIHLGISPRSPLLRTKDSPEHFAERVREAGLAVDVRILQPGESWNP